MAHKSHLYRINLFREVSSQLLGATSDQQRFEVTVRAERLLDTLQEGGQYACDQLIQRITRWDGDLGSGVSVSARGADVRHDLRLLIEDVVGEAVVPIGQVKQTVLTVEDLSRRWNVSAKTVNRWRRRGLIGRKFLIDGRTRIGFLADSVDRFAARHPEILRRGAKYQRLTTEQRAAILRRAKQLAESGLGKSQLVSQLARETGRREETLRKLLTGRSEGVQPVMEALGASDQREMLSAFRRGMSLPALAKKYRCSTRQARRTVNRLRAQQIRDLEVAYMPSPEFEKPSAESEIMQPVPEPKRRPRHQAAPHDVPAYVARLYEVPLLTSEQERHLFRKYNYLKFQVVRLREQLDPREPEGRLLDRIEQLYKEALETKNRIIRANLRLVVSLAKKRASEGDLFDKISDGNVSLMRAVEKFDYTLGFKFSTYATWAIKKNSARSYVAEAQQADRFRTGNEEVLDSRSEQRSNAQQQLAAQTLREEHVNRMMQRLTDREQFIIRRRFGIGPQREPQTLKQLGQELGVSKERVRQIESRAMKKLHLAAVQDRSQSPAIWEQIVFSEN